MDADISDAEWEALSPANFETYSLLHAVDAVDELRNDLNDGEHAAPPQLRTDLLKLHQLAMAVVNEGSRGQFGDLFELACYLDEQVSYMMTKLEEVQETLSRLMALYPDSLCYDGLDGDE